MHSVRSHRPARVAASRQVDQGPAEVEEAGELVAAGRLAAGAADADGAVPAAAGRTDANLRSAPCVPLSVRAPGWM